ncbi:oxidoreductase [Curtobacterium sp. MCBD17_013]|uniref:acrylyl-CoA reductase family protein n=1 Tax=Curtobacterium sp. MCBD17_013 TaxID=2175668 RepID=UPI000DAA22E0|nr:acryloyl-CoA reductase [Curtobacterium sp. MCBD17_013]PZF63028.1 oxidoreductase [Curtobacterium sp. MCBD17_013]
MSERTRAVVVRTGTGPVVEDHEVGAPGPDEVLVDVAYSSVNYKDGMALAGDPGVQRADPLVPGIDVVGTVRAVGDGTASAPAPGTLVTLNGAGLGETRDGGYAGLAVVPAAVLLPVPAGITAQRAAAIGTAGYTAALSVLALERFVTPGAGTVLVTGASGGVGSIAVALLAARGHRVAASTGRPQHTEALRRLGAAEVVDRHDFDTPGRPVQRPRWAGAVDSVGGATLVNVLAQTAWGGAVTACGLAQDARMAGSVLPFILRSVALLGVDSVAAPRDLRERAWALLAADLDPALLDSVTTTVGLADVVAVGREVLAGRVHGRTVVDVRA